MGIRGLLVVQPRDEDELVPLVGSRFSAAMPVANEPLVRYGIRSMAEAGVARAILAGPPSAREEVMAAAGDEHGVELEWADVEHRGAVGAPAAGAAVAAAAERLDGDAAFVHYADTLALAPFGALVETFTDSEADALLLGADGDAPDGVVSLSDHRKRKREPTIPTSAARIGLLSPRAIAAAAELPGHAGLHEIASAVARDDGNVEQRMVDDIWSCSGTVDAVLEGNRLVLDSITAEADAADLSAARIEGRVRIHPSAVLDRATVRGPATIGPGAILVDTFVGPYTSIGEGVRLEGTEIEFSIVLPGATIRHPGRRLESSLVGNDATITRDFALPSSLRLRIGRRADISLT